MLVCYHIEACYSLMRYRKGVDLEGREEKLRGIEEG